MWKTTPVLWTSTPMTLHNYFFLCKTHPGDLRPGGTQRRYYRLPLYLRLCPRQHRRLHRRHRKQPPRAPIATPCNTVLIALLPAAKFLSPVATDYRANRNSRAALAGLFQEDPLQQLHTISREFGHRVPTQRRRVQHRVRLRHDQHARKRR